MHLILVSVHRIYRFKQRLSNVTSHVLRAIELIAQCRCVIQISAPSCHRQAQHASHTRLSLMEAFRQGAPLRPRDQGRLRRLSLEEQFAPRRQSSLTTTVTQMGPPPKVLTLAGVPQSHLSWWCARRGSAGLRGNALLEHRPAGLTPRRAPKSRRWPRSQLEDPTRRTACVPRRSTSLHQPRISRRCGLL